MTGTRTFRPVGVVYSAGVLVAVWATLPDSVPIPTVIELLPLALGMVYVDKWVNWVGPGVQWSYGSVIAISAMVIAPRGTAALVGAAFGALGALTDQELKDPNIGRVAVNAAQLGIAGWAGGVAFDAFRLDSKGPSSRVVLATLIAVLVITTISALLVVLAIRYRQRTWVRSVVAAAMLSLGWRKLVAAVAAATIASTVGVVGPGWILFALVQIAALGAIPVVRSRLEARRRDIMAAVTSALNARGVVGSEHDHLEATALTLGHRLGLDADQIEQLRYVALLYSMTDHFSSSLPRSFEEQLRGLSPDAFSSALLLGLPLADVADPVVLRIADAAAEYEVLVRPIDGSQAMAPNEAAAELLRSGADPKVVAALLDTRPLPATYLKVWEIDPASPWRRPMQWFARHAS